MASISVHVIFATVMLVSLAAGEETPTQILQTLLSSYDGNLRPYFGGEAVNISVSYYLQRFVHVDEEAEDLSFTMYFKLQWSDPRLKFKSEQFDSINVPKSSIKQFWRPDMFFPLAKSIEKETEPASHELLLLSSKGDIYNSERLLVKVPCDNNYKGFPWDRLKCTVDIELYSVMTHDVHMAWRYNGHDEDQANDMSGLQRLNIASITQKSYATTSSSGTHERLSVIISLTRSVRHYVTHFYLPWVFLVILAYLALWIHGTAIFVRFMALLAVVIMMAAHSIGNRINYNPPTADVTPMDVYGAGCYMFIFLALAETVLVAVLEGNKQQRSQHEMLQLESAGLQPTDTDDTKPLEVRCRRGPHFLAHLDVITRIMFAIMFAFFNLIYWLASAL